MARLAGRTSGSEIRRKAAFDPMWAAGEIMALRAQILTLEEILKDMEMDLDAMRRMDSGY